MRVITEGFYAFSLSNYAIGVLEREGIPVVRVDDKTLSQLNRMFHNKIWISDGEEAILGGMNILNYQNKSIAHLFHSLFRLQFYHLHSTIQNLYPRNMI